MDDSLKKDFTDMLNKDNKAMREAGCELAMAASRVISTYDGIHRLSMATSNWFNVIANEGNRDRFKSK